MSSSLESGSDEERGNGPFGSGDSSSPDRVAVEARCDKVEGEISLRLIFLVPWVLYGRKEDVSRRFCKGHPASFPPPGWRQPSPLQHSCPGLAVVCTGNLAVVPESAGQGKRVSIVVGGQAVELELDGIRALMSSYTKVRRQLGGILRVASRFGWRAYDSASRDSRCVVQHELLLVVSVVCLLKSGAEVPNASTSRGCASCQLVSQMTRSKDNSIDSVGDSVEMRLTMFFSPPTEDGVIKKNPAVQSSNEE
ncbi:hypothetical protein B0T21DRAFT_438210 [Apiosordaria backusii]|uniref:Uncharacterized protein n=1 Tax=Apiosordaria backusii TaxID=314023 RepID=A0AA40BMS8_9PEZI|nr:hypothetical protein B0T21DRAFT_438210 [Apiosordaria backusii]